MFGEIFKGIGQRVRLENSLQLQRAQHVRPPQVKLEIAKAFTDISTALQDPVLKQHYDRITLVIPGAEGTIAPPQAPTTSAS